MPARAPRSCPRPGCPHVMPCPAHPASWGQGQHGRAMPPGWGGAALARQLLADTARDHSDRDPLLPPF